MKKLPKINTAKLLKAALPYIFIGLMATKLGQAYRMVPEGDVLDKALGALLNIGTVFQNPLPSFHPFDLIVGAVCGVLIWFIVYQKSKNARKYRRGAEYGTARWGTAKDIEPFIDPDFSQNILLSDTERLTLGKIADPEKRNVNLNVLVIGGSGSGKTRYHIKPNLLQMNASYVCSDPKGTVIEEVGRAMVRGGYKIKVLNQRYALEDKLIKFYPQAIKREQELIAALEADIKHLEAHTPADKEHFSMTVLGQTYTERKEAGQAIIHAFDRLKDLSDKVELGEYRGFPMTLWVSDSGFSQKLQITLKYELSHSLEPGSDPSGNITRIDNALDSMKENLQKHQAELANLLQQTEDAKVEVKRPFPQEAELAEKSNRLNVLNVALNIGGKDAPKDRERQRHDGKTSIKRLLRRMGVESAASASAPKKETDLEVAI